jgi:hypothetical protein
MALVTKDAVNLSGGLVSFLTVARASINRMLDAPLGMVSTWLDGQPLYTSSFGGADWHWQADFPAATVTDNETTCRPTSWVAGGLNGAAVRDLQGNPYTWAQTAWDIDSTTADNEGNTTLKTDVEIQRRWGPSPFIGQPTIITYVQSPATLTNLNATLLVNGSITLLGTRTIDRASVTITAVTAQNRATQTPLAITGAALGATDVGKLAIIISSGTPANVGAYAPILKDQGGGSVMVGKFGTTTVAVPFTEITPAVNDVIDVVSLTQLSIGRVEFTQSGQTLAQGSPTRNLIVFDSIKSDGNSVSGQGSLVSNNVKILFQRAITQHLNTSGLGVVAFSFDFAGGLVSNVLNAANFRARKTAFTTAGGGTGLTVCGVQPFVQLDADCYFENAPLQVNQGSSCNTLGVGLFDRSVANTAMSIAAGATVRQSGAIPDWGTNNTGHGISIVSTGNYTYATKPTVNGGLGAGREAIIGGTDKLYAAVPYIEGANNAALVLSA